MRRSPFLRSGFLGKENEMENLSAVRKTVNDFLTKGNTVDRLMTDKVDDYILIEEQPLPIAVGSKILLVGNLTLENETRFFREWAVFLSLLAARICNWELADEKKKELLEKCSFKLLADGSWMIEFLYRDAYLWKEMTRIIGKTMLRQQAYYLTGDKARKLARWSSFSFNYFKRNITKEKLIQIAFLIYLYNFDSVKKNLTLIMEKMNLTALSETYMPFWLQHTAGVGGKFLLAQVDSPASVFDDTQSEPPQEANQKKGVK